MNEIIKEDGDIFSSKISLTNEELSLIEQVIREEIKSYKQFAKGAVTNSDMKHYIKTLILKGSNDMIAKYQIILKKMGCKVE